ncbi:MAG: LD-carboxypeptidase [Spirochaetaceae bacterium]|nr:MAG: LD-carboxypeptidase [Spirochaetaceae bacterium]
MAAKVHTPRTQRTTHPLRKPQPLRQGDRIGIIAPSGSTTQQNALPDAIDAIESLGFRVTVGATAAGAMTERYGYLAAGDAERADDVHRFFADPQIDAVLCLKGGYGTPRILDLIDYDLIARHPKLFIGYSDITGLHLAFARYAGFPTIHGPMASGFGELDAPSRDRWLRVVTNGGAGPVRFADSPGNQGVGCVTPGVATGRLTGGNLALVSALVGTDYALDPNDAIVFLEDVDEAPYRVDRMLNQLRLAGYFDACSGVVLGTWERCVASEADRTLTLAEVFADQLGPSGKPVLSGVVAGHGVPTLTLPMGVPARIDASCGRFEILEPATEDGRGR